MSALRLLTILILLVGGNNALAKGIEEEILDLVNEHRAELNLPPLRLVSAISKAAEQHSEDMADGKVPFGHSGFDARIDKILAKTGGMAAGENVAYGSRTAIDVVKMWLNSKGHRKNIEGNFNLTGIGVAKNRSGTIYFTQIFIRTR